MVLFISPQVIILIIAIALNSILAFVVFRNNPKSATNALFALLSLLMSFWLIANYLSIQPQFFKNSLLLIRFTIFLATPLSTLVFLLAHTLPNPQILLRKQVFLLTILLTLAVMVATLSPFAFTDVKIENNSPKPTPGLAIPFFGVFSTTMIIAAVYLLVKKLRSATGVEKRQIFFVLLGISGMFSTIILTVFLPVVLFETNFFVQFIPLYALFFLGMTAYAIIKHQLFNIRVIATEMFSAATIIIFLLNVVSSKTRSELLFNSLLFVLLSAFGILLVRGTIREIRELQRISQIKSDFVSLVSHQLRTPLTAIKGFVSMVIEGSGTEKDRRDWLEKTFLSNERLIRLVNDILDVSRIEEGRIAYNFKPTDISGLIDSVVSEIGIAAKDKGLTVLWQKPETAIPNVYADEIKLRQVIINLIDNSIKYTSKGWVSVRLLHYRDLGKIQINIQDTGIGISKEDLDNLFGKFSRGKSGKETNTAGMGIGLYVAKHIILAHKGKIWAESEGLNSGSKFYVELPVA